MIITGEQIQRWRRQSSPARFWLTGPPSSLWMAGRGRRTESPRRHPKDVPQPGICRKFARFEPSTTTWPRGRCGKQAAGRATLYFEWTILSRNLEIQRRFRLYEPLRLLLHNKREWCWLAHNHYHGPRIVEATRRRRRMSCPGPKYFHPIMRIRNSSTGAT